MEFTVDDAKELLKMHEGSCSVLANSTIGRIFERMAVTGKVTIRPSGTAGFIDVYSKDFKPRFVSNPDENTK